MWYTYFLLINFKRKGDNEQRKLHGRLTSGRKSLGDRLVNLLRTGARTCSRRSVFLVAGHLKSRCRFANIHFTSAFLQERVGFLMGPLVCKLVQFPMAISSKVRVMQVAVLRQNCASVSLVDRDCFIHEEYRLLGYDAMWCGRCLITFRKNMFLFSS
jgi:hypothetical protein